MEARDFRKLLQLEMALVYFFHRLGYMFYIPYVVSLESRLEEVRKKRVGNGQ